MQVARFTVAYWCVLIAALLPMVCALLAKRGSFRGADNHDPRAWLARQGGWRARALQATARIKGEALWSMLSRSRCRVASSVENIGVVSDCATMRRSRRMTTVTA